jgi:hypothetical protein
MRAKVGDWLLMKGTTTGQHDQRGLISEVHSEGGSPPYVVRWLATEHEAIVYPGSDAIVVTAEEQRKPTNGHARPPRCKARSHHQRADESIADGAESDSAATEHSMVGAISGFPRH